MGACTLEPSLIGTVLPRPIDFPKGGSGFVGALAVLGRGFALGERGIGHGGLMWATGHGGKIDQSDLC